MTTSNAAQAQVRTAALEPEDRMIAIVTPITINAATLAKTR
jgi:hypothetical protein